MNRTGISQERAGDIGDLARHLGAAFRGLHYYDGHIAERAPPEKRWPTLVMIG